MFEDGLGDLGVVMISVEVDDRARHDAADERTRVVAPLGQALYMLALSAVMSDGRRITVDAWGVQATPPILLSEIREHLDIGLGRVAEHRAPRSAWDPLLAALASNGVCVTESDLRVLPLRLAVLSSATSAVTFD